MQLVLSHMQVAPSLITHLIESDCVCAQSPRALGLSCAEQTQVCLRPTGPAVLTGCSSEVVEPVSIPWGVCEGAARSGCKIAPDRTRREGKPSGGEQDEFGSFSCSAFT